MYCSHCGEALQEHASFCSSCGAAQRESLLTRPTTAVSAEPGEPVLTLKPVFVPSAQLLAQLPIFLFLALWGGGFFGGFSHVFLQFADLPIPAWLPFAFFGVFFVTVPPLVSIRVTRKTYERTTYTLYRNQLDYFEGYFNVEEKSIPLSRITEVQLRKGVLQSKYGLGTILLSTPMSSAGTGVSRSGIRLNDIEDPDETYRAVKELVDRAREADRRMAA